jgi:hypothetical protein
MAVRPGGITVAADGTVFATNYGSAGTEVSVFDPGMTTRNEARTLTGLHSPVDVAVKPSTGQVFVANFTANDIAVFEPGATTSNDAKRRTGVTFPSGLAFGPDGTMYVSSYTERRIYVFGDADLTPVRWFATEYPPVGIALHPVTGDLYVSGKLSTFVQVFDPATGIERAASLRLTGLSSPYDVTFHTASQAAYVSNYGEGLGTAVSVFPPGLTSPGDSLSGLTGPWGVAISPTDGRIFVGDETSVPGFRILAYPAPVMDPAAIAPQAGPVTGGTAVTITGSNLGAVTGVTFGGVAATNVVAVSPTTVTAVAPAHAVGKVDVAVSWGSRTAGLAQAFEYTAVAPGKATGVVGSPGNGQVTVSWTPPADTGGVPVASYTVTPTPAGPACATAATSCTISGLTNGTKYTFVVRTTNTANLSSDSDPSAEVTPYVPIKQTVKAKKASSKLPRKGYATVVNWVKKPSYADRVVNAGCTNPTGVESARLCKFTIYRNGKVKVRTKGYRNVQVTITIQSVPKAGAPVQYGPSAVWTRTWRVR